MLWATEERRGMTLKDTHFQWILKICHSCVSVSNLVSHNYHNIVRYPAIPNCKIHNVSLESPILHLPLKAQGPSIG